MLVYVINKNGKPLMPCKPAKARKLLRDKKAKIVNRCPFTIQLQWDCEENVQPVTLGIDKGSHQTGLCNVGNGKILLSGIINHRTDIKDKMTARRGNRRQRRTRLWYRPKRFLNRAKVKRSGRLPPSTFANANEVIRVVGKIPLPISRIVVEDVQVDIARLNTPDLTGTDYQQSNRFDENLRIATLMRDKYQCVSCGKKKVQLQAHHIVPQCQGGKDTIKNLITLCQQCHKKVHQGKITLAINGISGLKDQIAQRTMQGKSLIYKRLGKFAPVFKVFGYQTAQFRKDLGLPKEHDVDALCVATLDRRTEIPYHRENFYTIKFRPRQTRRRYHDLPQKGKGRVPYQVNAELDGFRKGDIVRVKDKWTKQINSIYSNGRLAFARVLGEPSNAKSSDCQLLLRSQTVVWSYSV
jgi:5-methylcytosine-specific restriction endonuclease McrA